MTSRITPPHAWGNAPRAFLTSLRSPWYGLMIDLQDIVVRATFDYAHGQGLKALQIPLTTRTVTCPTGLGSDSEPVPVSVSDVQTYLSDSAQFPLEYGCRLAEKGCYTVLPSFRNEDPDETHLNQFTHSEAEIVGGLDDIIEYVEGYVRHLSRNILNEYGRQLSAAIQDVTHLERMADGSASFPRVTFGEARKLLSDCPDCIRGDDSWRVLTRRGERRLMKIVNEFVWVTHLDHLSVPFYQAFGDSNRQTAACADLFFGMGEIVGSGERHRTGDEVVEALDLHAVAQQDYAWYVDMKKEFPLQTAGFGMGVERYLMWVVNHDDIRDIPFISRIDEEKSWPASVDRP
ncbi:amino acid--tRNA ligase-related protein [Streptomyces lincolnensis]|uniref:amino acid--tRNA ligase-related protein n=1 Tax=Streptomyces lincolnensis TaxID=1915 RepID=UPI0037D57169